MASQIHSGSAHGRSASLLSSVLLLHAVMGDALPFPAAASHSSPIGRWFLSHFMLILASASPPAPALMRTLRTAPQHYYLHQPNLQSPEKRSLAILTSSFPTTSCRLAVTPALTATCFTEGSSPKPYLPLFSLCSHGCCWLPDWVPAAEVSAQSIVLGLWAPEQPQMVSPHAAALQETVTYTRASCKIWGGRRGADEKAHSCGSSALTSTPAALPQQLPSMPVLSQQVAVMPALICWFLESGVGAEGAGGARTSHIPHPALSCILVPASHILHPVASCITLHNPASHILHTPFYISSPTVLHIAS